MQLTPIATLRSPYKQKFAVPRQPNIVKHAIGEIHFLPEFSDPNVLRGIEQFSHLWLIFAFHQTESEGWSPLTHPPRLGGKEKVGVFATRSTHRPNPCGLSAVELIDWQQQGSQVILRVRGIDLIDGTPIFDIKPYIPYADSIPDAQAGYANETPPQDKPVHFSEAAQAQLQALKSSYAELEPFICAVLTQDPRPAYRQHDDDVHEYGMSLYDLNIRWKNDGQTFMVTAIDPATNRQP